MALLLDYMAAAPGAIGALAGLNKYSDQCSISPVFRRLLEVLVSNLNGCSYCIEVHTHQAIELGRARSV